jgi:hypothetical protein
VSKTVVDVLRQLHKMPSITEGTVFGRDLVVDDFAKELYFFPIKMSVERVGCVLGKKFTPAACRKAATVRALANAAFDAL